MKDITLGQYFPGNSVIHRLDSRTKLLGVFAYIALVFVVNTMPGFLIPLAFVLIATAMAGLPLGLLMKNLKPIRTLVIFMFIINLLMMQSGTVLLEWWKIKITTGGISHAIFICLRLFLLVAGTAILTLTTTPISLTDAIERLLSPLAKIKFPAHELAMMMTIALRFIPILMEEADKIMKAQLARGADLDSGNLIKRIRAMVPILVPLFISAFRRADELALAMESRCYHGGEGRTRMNVQHFSRADAAALVVIVSTFAALFGFEALYEWSIKTIAG